MEAKVIGKGSYGTIYAVGQDVFKVIKLDDDISWIREVIFINNLNHPNIIRTKKFGFDYEKDDVFYVMNPYITLREVNVLSEDRLKFLVESLVSAITYLHKYKILHRDIKESNIFVSKDLDKCYLGDFGSARFCTKNTMTPRCTTLSHRSPETIEDYNADIWSLGIVIFYLIVGQPLYKYIQRYRLGKLQIPQLNKLDKTLNDELFFEEFLSLKNVIDIIVQIASDNCRAEKHWINVLKNCLLGQMPSLTNDKSWPIKIIEVAIDADGVKYIRNCLKQYLMTVEDIAIRKLLYNKIIDIVHYYAKRIDTEISRITPNMILLLAHIITVLYSKDLIFVQYIRGNIIQLLKLLMIDMDFFRDILCTLIIEYK